MRLVFVLVLACACSPIEDFAATPFVQKSIDEAPRWRIDINRIRDGIYRSYAPRCTDQVRIGHVVEFRNFNPEIAANVSTISGPTPLYSPNLKRPYNYVASDDPKNDLCDSEEAGKCVKRPAWSYWRYKFSTPGVYDWIDTNQGDPGRKVVDSYYGTVTFVGIDPNTPLGAICVANSDGSGCQSVCCTSDADCLGNTTCDKSGLEATGRCRSHSE